METATLLFIIVLVIIVVILLVYNYIVHKKIETYSNLNQRVISLNILQDFMDTLSATTSIKEKLESINDILINKYSIKYSTIVVFNGAEYEIKASNVDMKHWDSLKNLQNDQIFSESIQSATPKYITVDNPNEKLPYQKSEFGRAKCAMFFPLYIDNVYIGYWIIEGSEPHEFDKFDTTILGVVRDNIVKSLKTVSTQSTIENMVRDDQYSGLKSEEYLYSEGKKMIDQYATSAVCIFKIVNLPDINKNISRETGNSTVTAVAKYVEKNLAKNYILVRYMGPKFAIIFSGVDVQSVGNFMRELKERVEKLQIEYAKDYYKHAKLPEDHNIEEDLVKPKIRVVIATYYKGTSLDGALKRIEEYIDQNNDNTISIL